MGALVEPSLDGLERILKGWEPVRRFAMRRYKLDNRAINRSVPIRVIADWAKRIGTPITGQQGQPWVLPAERRALILRGLSRALRTWTDATAAVDYFLKWLQILGKHPKPVEFTRNWEHSKALAFAAALVAAHSPDMVRTTWRGHRARKCCKCGPCRKLNRKCSFVYNWRS